MDQNCQQHSSLAIIGNYIETDTFEQTGNKGKISDDSDQFPPRLAQGIHSPVHNLVDEGVWAGAMRMAAGSAELVLLLRDDGTILDANRAAIQAYGYTRRELLSMTYRELRAKGTGNLSLIPLVDPLHPEQVVEDRHRRKDGSLFPVEIEMRDLPQIYPGVKAALINVIIIPGKLHQTECAEDLNFQKLVDDSPDAVIVHINGKVVYANWHAANLLEFESRRHILNLPLVSILHSEYREKSQQRVEAAYRGEMSSLNQGRLVTRSGQPLDVEVKTVPIVFQGRPAGETIFHNITEWKQRERELNAMLKLTGALNDTRTLGELLPALADLVFDAIQPDAVAVSKICVNDGQMVGLLGRGLWAEWAGRTMNPAYQTESPLVNEARLDMITNALQSQPDWNQGAPIIAGILLSEINQGSPTILWMGFKTENTHHWAARHILDNDQRFLGSVSEIVQGIVRRVSLKEKTERRLQRLVALHAIDLAITSSPEIHFVLDIFLAQVAIQLGVDASDILLVNSDGELEFAAGRGFRFPDLQKTCLRQGRGLAERAMSELKTISIPNLKLLDDPTDCPLIDTEPNFISYFGIPLVAKGQVKGVLEVFNSTQLNPDIEWLDFMQSLATQAAIAIHNAGLVDSLQKSNTELVDAYDKTIEGWARAQELRDEETSGHAQRVVSLTEKLAKRLGYPEGAMTHLRRGVLLHDIGKIAIPDAIIHKAGPLDAEEMRLIHLHPAMAFEMLASIKYLEPAVEIPYCHHERWDGSGYPRGLKMTQIPLAARMFSVVDVWDALCSDRPYRPRWETAEVFKYIREQAGKQFDPSIVDAFLDMMTGEVSVDANAVR